jgi:Ca2+/Na+ antiporter
MSLELVIVFFLVLLMLKASLFKSVSVATIVGFTIILVFLILIVKSQEKISEHFEESQNKLVYLQGLATSASLKSSAEKEGNKEDHPTAHDDGDKKEIDVGVEETLTEDIDMLTKNVHLGNDMLMFYYSVFSPISYKVTSNIWQSATGSVGPLMLSEAPYKFISEKNLVKGIPLHQNKIKGPDSSALGLRGEADYTIHIMMRYGQLRRSPENMEIFTLYSADPKANDPIGISMMLREVDQSSVVQSAELVIKLSNNSEVFVMSIEQGTRIPLETDMAFTFTISKSVSQLSVYMSKVSNQSVVKVLQANNIQPCFQFVNLPVELNPHANVDANILIFGAHGSAFDQDQVCGVHSYLYKTYKRMNDKEYLQALSKVRELEKEYKAITSCPLDKDGCATCDDVKDWANLTQVLTASQRCHEKIISFCDANPKSELCKCWDASSPAFTLPTCRALRDSFAGKEIVDMNALSDDELKKIKARYDMCKSPAPSPSPSPAPPPEPAQPPAPTCPAPQPTCTTQPPPQPLWPTNAPIVTPPPTPNPTKKCKKKPVKEPETGFFAWVTHLFSAGDDDDDDEY